MDPHQPDALKIDTENRTCETHGDYEAKRLFGTRFSYCPACIEQEREARKAREEAEARSRKVAQREARISALFESSGLIGRQLQCTFDSYRTDLPQQKAVLDDCRAFMGQFVEGQRPPKNTLWLIGTQGTGKSHLGAAMVSHLINTHATPACIHTVQELIRMLRATWNRSKSEEPEYSWIEEADGGGYRKYDPKPESEDKLIERLGNCSLLVLDDVGADLGSAAGLVQLLEIVDLRYRLEKPTVVLSNLNATDLKAKLGDRLYDRLREGATMKVCKWESGRGQFPTRAAV
jgi:DNA replication protein DnaC